MRARRAERQHRVDVPAALRRTEHLRCPPRQDRRGDAVRTRRAGAGRAPLRAGDEPDRDDLGDRDRLARRPRRTARQRGPDRRRPQPPRGGADARPPRPLPRGSLRDRAGLRGPPRLRAQDDRLGPRRRARRRHRCRRRDPAPPPGRHGPRARRRRADLGHAAARPRRERLLRADLVRRRAPAGPRRRCRQADLRHGPGLAPLAGAGQVPRPSLARRAAALGADAEGADVRADRRDGRGADDLAPGDARRRAQLGLSLHLDPRRDLRALGPARARPRRRGQGLHGIRRAGDRRRRRPPDHVRDRRREGADRVDPRPPQRLPRLAAGPDRQCRLLAAPERRLRRPARLDLHSLAGARRRQRRALDDRLPAGRGGDGDLGAARPGDLGGARRAEALPVVEADVLGGARPRHATCEGPRRT